MNVAEGQPADLDRHRIIARGHAGRSVDRLDALEQWVRVPLIAHPQNMRQPLAIGLDRGVVSGGRAEVALPVPGPLGRGFFDLPEQEPVHSSDQLAGDVAGHRERLRARQGRCWYAGHRGLAGRE